MNPILITQFSYSIIYPHHLTIQPNLGPIINDPNLKSKLVVKGIDFPTSMAFLGPDDILVLEKNQGTVKRILNGTILPRPLLSVNVATENERGILGIAVTKNVTRNTTYVFLYYTKSRTRNGEDVTEGKDPLCACLYRYELVGNKLVNPRLLLSLPATPGSYHTPDHLGGKILIGPDKNVYVVIGDVGGHMTTATNIKGAQQADGTGGILRITQDGNVVHGIIGNKFPLSLYYAYGIRNSFGMDFDPVTGKLWDTENGPSYGDEINLVGPGFNSGWMQVQGIWRPTGPSNFLPGNITLNPDNLQNFGGKGKYRPPEFTWYQDTGPTAIKFLNSDKLGKQYKNDMFVGDFHNGNLYHFKLNHNRTDLVLPVSLVDKVARNDSTLRPIIFGHGFGGITDIQIGPDGYLYVLSLYAGGDDCNPILPNAPCFSYNSPMEGSIFRIVPINK
ncbi:MAG: PQQ-dependent sugar dehydrogenase [Nitrososphaeraceae archaeon]|nr:PQQ-dependent sugar dehydrogenase [Nitrososphaeraceae archaeon]